MGDQIVDVDLAFHVPIDDLRHVGAASCPAKGCPAPNSAGDQLEGARGDFLAGPATPMMTLSPSFVAALERLTHHVDIADALEAVVRPASVRSTRYGTRSPSTPRD